MTQISVNFDNDIMENINKNAQEKGFSPEQYIYFIVDGYFTDKMKRELKRKKFLRELWESEPDETFVEPPDYPPDNLDWNLEGMTDEILS